MPAVHKIVVDSNQFNLAEATAPKQRELLTMIGSRIAYNQASTGIEIDENMIIGQLLSMSDTDLQRVSDIVLWKTVKNGTENIVSVEDFQGQISVYMRLLAGGVRANLLDFFDYLHSVSAEARAEMPAQE